MENKYKRLVAISEKFDEAVQKFGEALQPLKEHNKKYKHFYANENLPKKQL